MKKIFKPITEVFVRFVLVWTVFALSFQISMLTLSLVNPELERKIGNEIMWKIDGTFRKGK